jgi:hypothetical protein
LYDYGIILIFFKLDNYVVFKIVDKKVAKRTAIQEQVIVPLRSYSQMTIELIERDGERNQTLTVENSDLVHAEVIDNLTVKVK